MPVHLIASSDVYMYCSVLQTLQSSNGRYLYIHLMFFNLNFKKGQRQWTVTTQIKLDKCKEKTVIIRAPKCNKTNKHKIVIIALQSQMFVVSS